MGGDVFDAKCSSCSVGCPAVGEEKGLSLDFEVDVTFVGVLFIFKFLGN